MGKSNRYLLRLSIMIHMRTQRINVKRYVPSLPSHRIFSSFHNP